MIAMSFWRQRESGTRYLNPVGFFFCQAQNEPLFTCTPYKLHSNRVSIARRYSNCKRGVRCRRTLAHEVSNLLDLIPRDIRQCRIWVLIVRRIRPCGIRFHVSEIGCPCISVRNSEGIITSLLPNSDFRKEEVHGIEKNSTVLHMWNFRIYLLLST
jgi:hypothetical protein